MVETPMWKVFFNKTLYLSLYLYFYPKQLSPKVIYQLNYYIDFKYCGVLGGC